MQSDPKTHHSASADQPAPAAAENPWAMPIKQVIKALATCPDSGLNAETVQQRLDHYGPNRLRKTHTQPAWEILFNQLKSLVIIILGGASILAFAFGQTAEGIALVAVVTTNALIGFVSEWQAVRSMEALREMEQPTSRVRRNGREENVPVQSLVPGDLVLLQAGDIVPADLRVWKVRHLKVIEAALTGESVPADKRATTVKSGTPLAERANMLFKGTAIAKGSAEGIVTATGMQTELGHISQLAESAEKQEAPLQRRLDDLGKRFAYLTLGTTVIIAGGGLLVGQSTVLMIQTAIALGLAAIPEGAPIVATIALARGMWLMSRRQALVHRLTAVETLGSTQVIFTDKTGTLTQNRMAVRQILTLDDRIDLPASEEATPELQTLRDNPVVRRIIEIGVLCNSATPGDNDSLDNATGDPMEIALLRVGRTFSLTRDTLLQQQPQKREEPFDPEVMMMATIQQADDGYAVMVKGAPGRVMEACRFIPDDSGTGRCDLTEQDRKRWQEKLEAAAEQGLRLLAMADKFTDSTADELYSDLRLLGAICLEDPPAEGVADAIALCRAAGVRVNVVTGDQAQTALAICQQVGIIENGHDLIMHGRDLKPPDALSEQERQRVLDSRIFARVNPEQKLNLVSVFQESGQVVAMTGDGVNDAPALKQANIGIAMGRRGTEAAREAADMVLKDDAFSSIAAALEEGRIIFRNIRRSVLFMLCTNGAEVLVVAAATLAGAPLPLLPMQILFLNVITDVFPAMALGVGQGNSDVMKVPPRDPEEKILNSREWRAIAGWSMIIGVCILGAFTLGLHWLDLPERSAVTISFLTLGFGKLWFVFNLRERGSKLLKNDVVQNPWIWGSLSVCMAALLGALYVPGLAAVLKTEPPSLQGWSIILGFSLVPAVIGQLLRALQSRSRS